MGKDVVRCSTRYSPGGAGAATKREQQDPHTIRAATGAPTARTTRTRRRRRARGQAMVEFALVAPLFFLVFFGFVEFALINASIAGFNFAAKDGARIGSLLGRTDPTVDTQIVNDIRVHVAGVLMAQPVQIEVYKADEGGNPVTGSSGGIIENVYDINGNPTGSEIWPVDDRNDTLLDADYLGVKITFKYTYLTSYVSGGNASLTLTANSVQRIEPQDYQGDRKHTGGIARLAGSLVQVKSARSLPSSAPPADALLATMLPLWIPSRNGEAYP